MDAIDKGWQALHPRTMSKGEREHLRERGHALMDGEFSHGRSWGEACAQGDAMIAIALSDRKDIKGRQ